MKQGAPPGNRNAMRHGLRSGKLPLNCVYIERQINKLRRTLEDAVVAAHREVTILHASSIETACKWEMHGALALKWLREQGKNLKPMELLNFSQAIAKASTERDKAIATLKLDRDIKDDILEQLYRRVPKAITNGAS
jgi:hypothetical protein